MGFVNCFAGLGLLSLLREHRIKLYSLEIKNARNSASLCTPTLHIYNFSLFSLENGSLSSASLFVLSADYKPKKIKTEDIKKAKKRKQEEEEVM